MIPADFQMMVFRLVANTTKTWDPRAHLTTGQQLELVGAFKSFLNDLVEEIEEEIEAERAAGHQ